MKRWICIFLFLLLLPVSVLAESSEEFGLEDYVELVDDISYDEVAWNFPIDIFDMDPTMVVLANQSFLLSSKFVPKPLVKMRTGNNKNGGVRKASGGEMSLQQECAEALLKMFADAENDGYKLYLKSAYRSYKTQKTMYFNRLKKNKGKDDGWVSYPGASDHQTGLGCDVLNYAWKNKSMNSNFAKEKEAQWMAAHCAEYGFVIRYPKGKEEITKIHYEPWHLRYVGIPVATYIMDKGITLEEFHVELQAAIDEFIAAGGNIELVEPLIQRSAEE